MAEIHESKTSGNLLEVKNNGVTAFSVDVAGDIAYSGTASYEDLEATGDADIAGNADVGGDLAVVGEVAGATLAVSGAAATGALTVTGAASTTTTMTVGTSLQVTGGEVKDVAGLSRIVFAPAKTIVDGAATALFSVPVAALASIGGSFTFHVFATDATDMQAISGIGTYSAVNKAGTVTAAIDYETTNEAKSVSAGTLTLAFTAAEDSADVISFKLQPTGSLTESGYNITYTLFPHKGAVTIL